MSTEHISNFMKKKGPPAADAAELTSGARDVEPAGCDTCIENARAVFAPRFPLALLESAWLVQESIGDVDILLLFRRRLEQRALSHAGQGGK